MITQVSPKWGNEIDVKELEQYLDRGIGRRSIYGFGGGIDLMSLRCEKDYLEGYNSCPPLKAIILKRMLGFNSGIMKLKNRNTDKEATGRGSLKSLLQQPNVLQTQKSFFGQQNIYIDIFGYVPVLKIPLSGFEGEYSSMWNIPPWLFDLDYTKKWLKQYKLTGIYDTFYLYWNGEKVELDMKNVGFIFDSGIGTECDSNLLIPDSRLLSLEYPVSNIIASYKALNTLTTKRGAIGILSNEASDDSGSVPMRAGEKDALQKDFSKYGLVGQAYQIIITDAQLKWQQMGFATKDLLLHETISDSIDRIADAYGYPSEMLARIGKGVKGDNKLQARRDFIENTIVPDSEHRMEQFTQIIAPDDTIDITRDYSHLTVFQADELAKATKIKAIDDACAIEWKNSLITKNEWRIRIGLEPIDLPEFNTYYEEPKAEPNNQGTSGGNS